MDRGMAAGGIARGVVLALCAALFYGQVPVLARLAFFNGVPGTYTIVVRTLLVIFALSLLNALIKQPVWKKQASRWAFALQCLATIMVSSGLIMSVQFIPASLAIIIFVTAPVFILLLAPWVEGTSLSWMRALLALVIFAGLALVIGPEFNNLDPRGIALAGLAAVGYVLQFYSGRALSIHLPSTTIGALVHVAIFPVFVVLALTINVEQHTFTSVGVFAMLGVAVSYVMGYSLQMMSLARAPASRVVPFFNFEPIVTLLSASLILGETLSFLQYAGGAVVISALVAMSLLKS
jgi:drug/metabolite transporter (DMT)-like permease